MKRAILLVAVALAISGTSHAALVVRGIGTITSSGEGSGGQYQLIYV